MAITHWCETCDRQFTNPTCPRCGGKPSPVKQREDEHDLQVELDPSVSDAADTLDSMIEQASRPTLAQLMKRGIASGLIQPTQEYSAGNVS